MIDLTPERLRDIILGAPVTESEGVFSRPQAMALLLATHMPNKETVFKAVLENDLEPGPVRAVAATSLGRLASPQAQRILRENGQVGDVQALAGVMKALGRIAGATALPAVQAAESRPAPAGSQAHFAALLISHRLGLPGPPLDVPPDSRLLTPEPDKADPIRATTPSPDELATCLRDVSSKPIGITFDPNTGVEMHCGPAVRMLLFNQKWMQSGSAAILSRVNGLPAAIATRHVESSLYTLGHVVLTAPGAIPGNFDIQIHRLTGDPVLAGHASVKNDGVDFRIASIDRPGTSPALLDGRFAPSGIQFATALYAKQRRPPRQGIRNI